MMKVSKLYRTHFHIELKGLINVLAFFFIAVTRKLFMIVTIESAVQYFVRKPIPTYWNFTVIVSVIFAIKRTSAYVGHVIASLFENLFITIALTAKNQLGKPIEKEKYHG